MNIFFTILLICCIRINFAEDKCVQNNYRGSKPNIILIVSDDTGYGDLGVYGGGEGRGMKTPNLDQMAREGMQFWSFYSEPSCTPGRAALQTGRIPNRSGMTTVAFPGLGGGLPSEEWTIASILSNYSKQIDPNNTPYQTYFTGKWHLGEEDYALPTYHGYEVMEWTTLYHLNAYTYSWEQWNPDMNEQTLAFFKTNTRGLLTGEENREPTEVAKVTPENMSELDVIMTDSTIRQLQQYYNTAGDGRPFFMNINFAKNHQPNLPAQGINGTEGINFTHKSAAKSKYADSVVELDHNIGRILKAVKRLDTNDNTFVFYTVDNGAWQDVHPDSGYTPFRGSKGTVREGGVRVPAIAWWPGHIAVQSHSHDIVGGLDLLATFASLAGIEQLPKVDRAGEPIIFDSIDMSNVLFKHDECGKPIRDRWFYFTEQELLPGAIRHGKFKAVYNLRGDNGAPAGSDHPGQQLGWRGEESYVNAVPQVYDLWQDPQERYDIFMNSFTEKTWTILFFNDAMRKLWSTYVKFPPRKLQSQGYSGPISVRMFNLWKKITESVGKDGSCYIPSFDDLLNLKL